MKVICFSKSVPAWDYLHEHRKGIVPEDSAWDIFRTDVDGWVEIQLGWVNSKWLGARIYEKCPEEIPQTPDQADDASVQPTAVTAEDILKLIRSHNLTVETLDRVGTTIRIQGAQIMGAIEMWHRIACEGAEIVDIARRLGIDATIDMQKGKINLKSQQNS